LNKKYNKGKKLKSTPAENFCRHDKNKEKKKVRIWYEKIKIAWIRVILVLNSLWIMDFF